MNIRDQLISLETKLLESEVRRESGILEDLIDDTFLEFGASGRIFKKDDVVSRLPTEEPPEFYPQDFQVNELSQDIVQVTYKLKTVSHTPKELSYSLRSSIWKKAKNGWKMIFHQGTKTTPFA